MTQVTGNIFLFTNNIAIVGGLKLVDVILLFATYLNKSRFQFQD